MEFNGLVILKKAGVHVILLTQSCWFPVFRVVVFLEVSTPHLT